MRGPPLLEDLGLLAQVVERPLDTREVLGSMPRRAKLFRLSSSFGRASALHAEGSEIETHLSHMGRRGRVV